MIIISKHLQTKYVQISIFNASVQSETSNKAAQGFSGKEFRKHLT